MFFDNWTLRAKENSVFNKGLLWEYDLDIFDWQMMRGIVVERVLERGREEDFHAIFKLYGGVEAVIDIIKNEVPYLSDRDISFTCTIFDLNKETLKCYTRQQLRKQRL